MTFSLNVPDEKLHFVGLITLRFEAKFAKS